MRHAVHHEYINRWGVTMIQRMTSLGTFRSERQCRAKIAEMAARHPNRSYDLRVQPGGRFYIVCLNAGEQGA